MNEDQERKLKRVTKKIDEGLGHLRAESERELQMAVDNAERRERQIIRDHVNKQRLGCVRAAAHWKDDPATEQRLNDTAQAYANVVDFIDKRDRSLNEKRNRQANTQRVRDAVFKGGKRR